MRQLARNEMVKPSGPKTEPINSGLKCHVAMRSLTGLEFDSIEQVAAGERAQISARISEMLQRERVKGAIEHWSCDLEPFSLRVNRFVETIF